MEGHNCHDELKVQGSQIVFALKQTETRVAVVKCAGRWESAKPRSTTGRRSTALDPDELRRLRQLEEQSTEADRGGPDLGQTDAPRCFKNALRSGQRRLLANSLLADYRVSERRACAMVMLSRTVFCYIGEGDNLSSPVNRAEAVSLNEVVNRR